MNYYFSLVLTLITFLFPVITGRIRYRMLDKAGRIFYVFTVVSFATECVACIAASIYGNNLPVYNVSYIVQFGIIALYFNYNIRSFQTLKIGMGIIVLSTLIGVLNLIFLEPIKVFNSNYFLFQTIVILVMGAALIMQFLAEPYFEMNHSPHFWFTLILMSFYTLNFFSFSLYDYLTIHLKSDKYIIDYSILILNIVSNLGYGLTFFVYPKMKTQYHVG